MYVWGRRGRIIFTVLGWVMIGRKVSREGEYLEEDGHGSTLLLGYGCVFLLDHPETADC